MKVFQIPKDFNTLKSKSENRAYLYTRTVFYTNHQKLFRVSIAASIKNIHVDFYFYFVHRIFLEYQFMCFKACCPFDHYGPECKPCSVKGANGKLCSGNGKCKGR